jgi:hypothetical protein
MTTNETSFFRDVHPFDALRDVVLPQAAARGRVGVWSAAASTGQEAYSVAMLAADHFPTTPFTILGTDLSRDVLARADAGLFSQLEVNRGLPASMLVRHFERSGAGWRVRPEIRRRVEFRQLNLARPWPRCRGWTSSCCATCSSTSTPRPSGRSWRRSRGCSPRWCAVPRRRRDHVRTGQRLGARAGRDARRSTGRLRTDEGSG